MCLFVNKYESEIKVRPIQDIIQENQNERKAEYWKRRAKKAEKAFNELKKN